jgi:hypothetical protein
MEKSYAKEGYPPDSPDDLVFSQRTNKFARHGVA